MAPARRRGFERENIRFLPAIKQRKTAGRFCAGSRRIFTECQPSLGRRGGFAPAVTRALLAVKRRSSVEIIQRSKNRRFILLKSKWRDSRRFGKKIVQNYTKNQIFNNGTF